MRHQDVVIVGAGIVGLALARELKDREPSCRILVVEKEAMPGKHASGRNSGVLHSGIYYPAGSLKAQLCAEGARELAAYCEQHRLPIARLGKIVLPVREDDDPQLDLLAERARRNGARAELIDRGQLRELEPQAYSISGRALYTPDTAVVDPRAVLSRIARELAGGNVRVQMSQRIEGIEAAPGRLRINGETVAYGHLFNAAGVHADSIAHACGVGHRYTMLPFRGSYYELRQASAPPIRRLIYPVPDLRTPFLGIHFTPALSGKVYVGPSAMPALGREHYRGVHGIRPSEALRIVGLLTRQYLANRQGFRRLVHREGLHLFKPWFARTARALVPSLRPEHLAPSDKVGIRAQLLDTHTRELVMDFIVERGRHSTHILNAVSPAFTSAFSFARYVVDHYRLQ